MRLEEALQQAAAELTDQQQKEPDHVYKLCLNKEPFFAPPLSPDGDALVQGLNEKLTASNKRQAVLQQTVREKIMQYRDAVFQLLGYQVDLLPDGRVRLHSKFAASKNAHFLFAKQPDGSFCMLDTSFSESFAKEAEIYISLGRAVPAFLAVITSKLWEASTIEIRQ